MDINISKYEGIVAAKLRQFNETSYRYKAYQIKILGKVDDANGGKAVYFSKGAATGRVRELISTWALREIVDELKKEGVKFEGVGYWNEASHPTVQAILKGVYESMLKSGAIEIVDLTKKAE